LNARCSGCNSVNIVTADLFSDDQRARERSRPLVIEIYVPMFFRHAMDHKLEVFNPGGHIIGKSGKPLSLRKQSTCTGSSG
jgi:hypothetical protein